MNTAPETHELIIIGSGPAGLTAAIYASRANVKTLVVEGKAPGGQLMGTTIVENWPGHTQIMGPELMMKIREQAAHYGAQFLDHEIVSVDFKSHPFKLVTHRKKELFAHAVIVATGAESRRLCCPGEQDYWAKGVSTCAVCDGAFYKDRKVVIVGGGDTAMEHASFLSNFTKDITIIHILDKLTASYAMQQPILANKDIKIIYNSTVTSINGNGTAVTSVTVENQQTKKKQDIVTDGVFLAVGLKPNTAIFKDQLALNDYGYLVVTDETKTSIPGIFAAGDVQDSRYRQAITSAGAGCMAALDAERYLKTREQ